jgi:hypothetical protein
VISNTLDKPYVPYVTLSLYPVLDGGHQIGQFLLLLAPPLSAEIVGRR